MAEEDCSEGKSEEESEAEVKVVEWSGRAARHDLCELTENR